MKKSIYFFSILSTLLIGSQDLASEVIESSDISSTLVLARPDALFIFDLDNTLMEPEQLLGSDQWVGHQIESLTKKGLSIKEAVAEVIPCWLCILKKTKMRLVDPVIPNLFNHLKARKIAFMGLTKRDPASWNQTVEHLESLRIQFHPYEQENLTEEFPEGTLYKKGVLFTGKGVDKGNSLLLYLNQFSHRPSHIIAIDDKLAHLESVEKAATALGIPFIGVRYSMTDERVKNFDPQIAEIQWKHLSKILSDEEAKKLLAQKKVGQ